MVTVINTISYLIIYKYYNGKDNLQIHRGRMYGLLTDDWLFKYLYLKILIKKKTGLFF